MQQNTNLKSATSALDARFTTPARVAAIDEHAKAEAKSRKPFVAAALAKPLVVTERRHLLNALALPTPESRSNWGKVLGVMSDDMVLECALMLKQYGSAPKVTAAMRSSLREWSADSSTRVFQRIAFAGIASHRSQSAGEGIHLRTISAAIDFAVPSHEGDASLSRGELGKAVSVAHMLTGIDVFCEAHDFKSWHRDIKEYGLEHEPLLRLAADNSRHGSALAAFVADNGTDITDVRKFAEDL